MILKLILLIILFSSNISYSGVLPDIFYQSKKIQKDFCQNAEFQNETFWRKLVDHKITSLVTHSDVARQNAFVTKSYLELFELPGLHSPSQFMGYVYANGSHHLGRLVRFTKWPKNHPLKESDQELVKGVALRIIAGTASHELSRRLMLHSLNLYKELMWSLASASLCGAQYTLAMIQDQDLTEAFRANNISDFIRPFVTYEQSYLQKTMYTDFLIGHSTKARVLDEMRFISFAGKAQTSFKAWCEKSRCGTSSFDLSNRIEFDTYSIINEFRKTLGIRLSLLYRANEARIKETADSYLVMTTAPGLILK